MIRRKAGLNAILVASALSVGMQTKLASALQLDGPTVVLASSPGFCFYDADVVWVGAEYIVVMSSRSCPSAGADANGVMVQWNLRDAPSARRTIQTRGPFVNAFARVSSDLPDRAVFITGRQNAIGGWSVARLQANAGVPAVDMVQNTSWMLDIRQASFDCSQQGCLLAVDYLAAGQHTIASLGAGGAELIPYRSVPNVASILALQMGAESNIFAATPGVDPRMARWIAPNGPVQVIPPDGLARDVLGVVAARFAGSYLSISIDVDSVVRQHAQGLGVDPANTSTLAGANRLIDADSRGPVVVVAGTWVPPANSPQYFFAQSDGIRSFSLGAFELAGTRSAPGTIRVALEAGRNHSGTGLLVFERDRIGGDGHEVLGRRLMCGSDADCFDGDPLTPDRCVVSGAQNVCDRNAVVNPDADASTDASSDVPSDVRIESGVDGATAGADAIDALDVPASRADASMTDVGTDAVAPDRAGAGVRFSGGACECRVSEITARSGWSKSLGYCVVVAILLGAKSGQRFRRAGQGRKC
jgi:hypothetical protein